MRLITKNEFASPYPEKCPDWCKEGALVKTTVKRKSVLLGEYEDNTTYEIVSIHWFDPIEAKGIWGLAYLREKGETGQWTRAEYICDLTQTENYTEN